MEIALVEMARDAVPAGTAFPKVDEIPFDADRMRLTTVHALPEAPQSFAREPLRPSCPSAAGF